MSDFWAGTLIGGLVGLVAGIGFRSFVDHLKRRDIPAVEVEKKQRNVLLTLAVVAALVVNIGSASAAYTATRNTDATARDTAALSECQAKAYDALVAQLNRVGKIAAEDRQVIDDLVTAIPTLTTPEAFQAALDAYNLARATNEADRAGFPPYPQLSDICPTSGEPPIFTPTPSSTPSTTVTPTS